MIDPYCPKHSNPDWARSDRDACICDDYALRPYDLPPYEPRPWDLLWLAVIILVIVLERYAVVP